MTTDEQIKGIKKAIAKYKLSQAISDYIAVHDDKMTDKKKAKIEINPTREGTLRKTAGVKKGEKIPVAKLKELKNSKNPTTAKRANFALNFGGHNK